MMVQSLEAWVICLAIVAWRDLHAETEMAEMSDATAHARANLQYISDMLEQLKGVAAAGGGPMLVYLIDMARLEALEQLKRDGRPTSAQKRDASV